MDKRVAENEGRRVIPPRRLSSILLTFNEKYSKISPVFYEQFRDGTALVDFTDQQRFVGQGSLR